MDSAYQAGDVIASRFELVSTLGEGGMGAVWLARNLTLDVDVALKLIRRDLATEEASHRLLREARAVARLGHRSICRVYEFGETDAGDPFIAMELLEGESLTEVLAVRRRLGPIEAVQLMLPIVSALAAAHAKDIVHRDIKPDNIVLVQEDGGVTVPKLVDFGIAKLRHEVEPHVEPEPVSAETSGPVSLDGESSFHTQFGHVVGSPDYMSPEQAQSATDVDARADVWGIAVLLYELVAGRRPFIGGDVEELMRAILIEEPPPTTDFGADDDALWQIIEKGLAKNREHRWPTMAALGEALALWADARGVAADICGTAIAVHWLDVEPSMNTLHNMRDVSQPSLITLATAGTPLASRTRGVWLVGVAAAAVAVLAVVAVLMTSSDRPETNGERAAPDQAALPNPAPAPMPAAPTSDPEPEPSASATEAAPKKTPPRAPPRPAQPTPKAKPKPTAKPAVPVGTGMPIPKVPDF